MVGYPSWLTDHLSPLKEDLNDLLHAASIAHNEVGLRFALKKLGFRASLREAHIQTHLATRKVNELARFFALDILARLSLHVMVVDAKVLQVE